MSVIRFTIYGVPTAKRRHRSSVTRGGFVRQYKDAKQAEAEETIASIANLHRPDRMMEGPVSVGIRAYFPIPKSMPKWKQERALLGLFRPIRKPDLDNIAKNICDSLNGIMWADDRQVVSLIVSKQYAHIPCTEVTIVPLHEPENPKKRRRK